MSQMNPQKAFHNTAYSVHLPYIAGLCLKKKDNNILKVQGVESTIVKQKMSPVNGRPIEITTCSIFKYELD